MITPNSSSRSGSVVSFMYTRTLLRPRSSAFSVWPTGLHNSSKKTPSCYEGPGFAMMNSCYHSGSFFRKFPLVFMASFRNIFLLQDSEMHNLINCLVSLETLPHKASSFFDTTGKTVDVWKRQMTIGRYF